jgi:protein phosphatase
MDSQNFRNTDSASVKSLRLLRPSVVVLCGPAACGKSTFAERHFRPTQVISSDWARAHVCDDDRDQRFNAQAFALVHFLLEQRLTLNRFCVVDSTALTVQSRKELLELARKYQVPATLMLFDIPLETCIERDGKRERSVGQAVIERQYAAFEQSKAAVRQEGFDQVVELQDADLSNIQIEILFRPVVRPPQRPQRPDGAASRRFERSVQASKNRPSGPGGNGNSASTATVPRVAPSAAAPQPPSAPAPVSTPKVATTHVEEAGRQHPSPVHLQTSPAVTSKPDVPTPPVAPPKPARTAAPSPVPVTVGSSSES